MSFYCSKHQYHSLPLSRLHLIFGPKLGSQKMTDFRIHLWNKITYLQSLDFNFGKKFNEKCWRIFYPYANDKIESPSCWKVKNLSKTWSLGFEIRNKESFFFNKILWMLVKYPPPHTHTQKTQSNNRRNAMLNLLRKFLVKSLQIYSIKGSRTLKVQIIGRLNPQNNLKGQNRTK